MAGCGDYTDISHNRDRFQPKQFKLVGEEQNNNRRAAGKIASSQKSDIISDNNGILE